MGPCRAHSLLPRWGEGAQHRIAVSRRSCPPATRGGRTPVPTVPQPQPSRTLRLPEGQSAQRVQWRPSWAVGSRPAVGGKTEQDLAGAPGDRLRPEQKVGHFWVNERPCIPGSRPPWGRPEGGETEAWSCLSAVRRLRRLGRAALPQEPLRASRATWWD